VATSTLAFEGNGAINHYVGGYNDWLRQRNKQQKIAKKPQKAQSKNRQPAKKLSYKDQRELDGLPDQIDLLETKIAAISLQICQPDFYKGERKQIEQTEKNLTQLQQQLSHCYKRWEVLDKQ
jgi:ATP-binding cassette subfamily F protein uup